jgi:hypothetical protein
MKTNTFILVLNIFVLALFTFILVLTLLIRDINQETSDPAPKTYELLAIPDEHTLIYEDKESHKFIKLYVENSYDSCFMYMETLIIEF